MNLNLKCGVVVIGSLFWQEHLHPKKKDGIRSRWRKDRLDMSNTINVRLPIKYGRFSGYPEDGNYTYTMTFDNKLEEYNYGTAKVIPLLNSSITHYTELRDEISALSEAEGEGVSFLKGEEPWCICSLLLNPNMDPKKKTDILGRYQEELMSDPGVYEKFKDELSKFSSSEKGELEIPWPQNAGHFDVLIAASTKHKFRPGIDYIDAGEIANFVYNRPYFIPNVSNGIRTFQDQEILDTLKLKDVGS